MKQSPIRLPRLLTPEEADRESFLWGVFIGVFLVGLGVGLYYWWW